MITRILSRATLGAMIATLAVSGVASAKAGDRSFQQTYPYASALCARAASNTLRPHLQPQVANVVAACNTLQSGFGPLQSTVRAAQLQFTSGVQTTLATIRAACAPGQLKATCRAALHQGRSTLRTLRIQHRTAVRSYYIGIEANRRTFWATIRTLRGGAHIRADARIVPLTS
ncbi:MAG: hypothetical protein ACR2ND_07340 [Solirubrobacteraceae bacterium]